MVGRRKPKYGLKLLGVRDDKNPFEELERPKFRPALVPDKACFCGGRSFWLRPDGVEYVCSQCHPAPEHLQVNTVALSVAKREFPKPRWW